MISDLLFLAKTDRGLALNRVDDIDLAAEIDALFEFYEALAESRSITLKRIGTARMTGDRAMLRRALSNLLSNGLRHADPGSCIEVRAETRVTTPGKQTGANTDGSIDTRSDATTHRCEQPSRAEDQGRRLRHAPHLTDRHEVHIEVINRGETIPAEHLDRIFERFHRVGSERDREGEGAGLGLAITRSIIAAHGGEIKTHSRASVTRFCIDLPCQPPRPGNRETS